MKPTVNGEKLILDPGNGCKAITLGSEKWLCWLKDHSLFIYQRDGNRFTGRRETRGGHTYWYGYCRREGKLHKVYLGKSCDLTPDRLYSAEEKLAESIREQAASAAGTTAELSSLTATSLVPILERRGIKAANDSFALQNRLTPPPLPGNLFVRSRLSDKLNKRIVLISAPRGYGKTTLLNMWQDQQSFPVAWITLEDEDSKPNRFWLVLSLALQHVGIAVGDTVHALLRSSVLAPRDRFVSRLIRRMGEWMAAGEDRKLAIILDDYHMVQCSEIDAGLQIFLDQLQEDVQVIIASEEGLLFEVQPWRFRNEIAELSKDDFTLTPREGAVYLERADSIHLTSREKMTLSLKADGWIAGLNILLSALKTQDDVHQFIATFDGYHPYLQEYHVKEVLRTQPEATQEFLLQTSILRNLCGSLCDAVTKRSGSEQLLQYIHQESQLLYRLGEGQGWYRYNDMFSQSLQHQLQQQIPEDLDDLHWRAAAWYQNHELYSEAIYHYLAAGAWPKVARLIDQVIIEELRRGSDHDVLRWLQQLPEEIFLRHPTLLFTYARLGSTSLPHGNVQSFLQRIAARIETKPAAVRSANEHALLSDLADWAAAGESNRVYPAVDSPQNEIEELWQMLDLRDRGDRLIREGKLAAGERMLLEAIDIAKKKRMLFVVVMVGTQQVSLIARQGRLRQAEAVARDILDWVRLHSGGSLPACASVLLVPLIKIHYARNQLSEARLLVEETVMIDPRPTSTNIHLFTHGLLALILSAQDDTDGALDSLQAALELAPFASRIFNIEDFKIRQAVMTIRKGDLAAAEQILTQMTTAMRRPFQAPSETFITAWALLFLALGKYSEAKRALYRLDESTPDPLLYTFPIQKILLAATYWAQHKYNQAEREMLWSVRASAAEGIIRPFLDCGPQIIPLLSFLLADSKLKGRQRAFVNGLLDQLQSAYPDYPVPSREDFADHLQAAKITAREQQVLQLLAEGLHNKELASRLMITDSTVRTHLRNIYRKFGVTSRTQAIKRARELHLL